MGRELRLSRPAFASNSRQGAAVERACSAACMQAKFGCSESAICAYRLVCQEANEQSSRAQGSSEPDRRGVDRAMTADQVHAVAVVGGGLRVEFLLKTESGYLRDAEVT